MEAIGDLLDGTPEEIQDKCIKYLEPYGWRITEFKPSNNGQPYFWAKTDIFGKDHRLNVKGHYFRDNFSYKGIQRQLICVKLRLLRETWRDFDFIFTDISKMGITCNFRPEGVKVKAKLGPLVLNERGYKYLKAAIHPGNIYR